MSTTDMYSQPEAYENVHASYSVNGYKIAMLSLSFLLCTQVYSVSYCTQFMNNLICRYYTVQDLNMVLLAMYGSLVKPKGTFITAKSTCVSTSVLATSLGHIIL